MLARKVAEHFLRTGRASIAAAASGEDDRWARRRLRELSARDDHRIAREGHWHFGDERSSQSADIVAATIATLRAAGRAISLANLENLKVAVTFLGPMIEILPAELDFDRWAIVVSDRAVSRAGGALPNTQVFTSGRSTRYGEECAMSETSEHVLYRQAVSKASSRTDVSSRVRLTTELVVTGRRGRRSARDRSRWTDRTVLDVEQIRTPICGVAVGLYRNGLKAAIGGSGSVADVRAAGKSAAAASLALGRR